MFIPGLQIFSCNKCSCIISNESYSSDLAVSIPALEKQTNKACIIYFKLQCVPRTKPFLGFGSRCAFHRKDAGPWSHQPHSVI